MVYEKQLELEELMARIRSGEKNPRATAPAVGEEKTALPGLLIQGIQSFIDNLPPFKLPPLPPFLPVLVFPTPSYSPTAATAAEVKPLGAEEEVTVVPEAEEFPSPEKAVVPLVYE